MATRCAAAEGRAFLIRGAQDEDMGHRDRYLWIGRDILRAQEALEETLSQDLKEVCLKECLEKRPRDKGTPSAKAESHVYSDQNRQEGEWGRKGGN